MLDRTETALAIARGAPDEDAAESVFGLCTRVAYFDGSGGKLSWPIPPAAPAEEEQADDLQAEIRDGVYDDGMWP
jgi:hypothetical protein